MTHQTITDIPNLLIVPAEALVLHEGVDIRRVEPLIEKIRQDNILKNPPIAAPISASNDTSPQYVILDGANRTTALWEMGIPHHLIQVVDYADVELNTWGHLITDISKKTFKKALHEANLDLQLITYQVARQQLAHRQIIATITEVEGNMLAIPKKESFAVEVEALTRLTSIYKGRAAIHRIQTDQLAEVQPYYDNITALISFPCYTPDEILLLTHNGSKLPAGITRHIIPQRALRVNFPLSILQDPHLTAGQKNEQLKNIIKQKLMRREIRNYRESTFLFDE